MAAKHRPLLYIETSVFGFCFDKEPRNVIRREAALTLFEQVRLGILNAVTSPVTFLELDRTAEPLRSELMALLQDVQILDADEAEVTRLTTVYLNEQVIPRQHLNDARHVAFATIGKADVLVSLNLRHIANDWTERSIGAVNLREGYQVLRVKTPEEVLSMKIDGLEWMDWLHKTRQKMEDERKRRGQSEVEWLREAGARARTIKQELAGCETPVAHDRKTDD